MNDKVNKKTTVLKFKVKKEYLIIQKKIVFFCIAYLRGDEVEDDVFFGKNSNVWQQALNRIHVQKVFYCIVLEN